MGLVMRKSFTLTKGVRLNVGTHGVSVGFGSNGLRQTIHSSGRRTTSIGIPGTGISYRTSSGGNRSRAPSLSQIQKQQDKANRQMQDAENVRQYNEYVNSIKSVHTFCDAPVDWRQISASREPFDPSGIGPRQAQARQAYETYNPGLFGGMFNPNINDQQMALNNAIEQAAREDNAEYEQWRNLKYLSGQILHGDVDAYFQVINEMNPLDDLLEYGSDFEFGANDGTAIEVEFRVKPAEVVPTYVLSLTPAGKLSKKEMTKTAYYDLMQDYVCSCALRIARDMFALLPLEKVVVHAVDYVTNASTGYAAEVTILSVVYDRQTVGQLNMQGIDPSDALCNFRHNMVFMKTSGFKPVERIMAY